MMPPSPSEMAIGEVESEIGINRREITADSKVILGQNPDGILDKRMRVLSFRKPTGELIVTLIHYGCHPTAAGPAPEISRDWPGFMTDSLEEFSGAPAVFFNGAEGDIGPRLSNGKTIGDMEQTKEIGLIAGQDAIQAFKNIGTYSIPQFDVKSGEISLPYKPLLTIEETKALIASLGNPDELIETDIILYSRCKKILEHYEKDLPMEKEWHFNQTYLSLDSIVFVPYPMEMFCKVSLDQQEASPLTHTLCLSNANGSLGYLPTEDQLPYGGYEIESFSSFNVFILQDNAARQIVDENNKLLRKLF